MPSKEKLLTLANNWLADCEFIEPKIYDQIAHIVKEINIKG